MAKAICGHTAYLTTYTYVAVILLQVRGKTDSKIKLGTSLFHTSYKAMSQYVANGVT